MKEKERYEIYKDSRENSYICDTSKNVDYKTYQEFVNLLNQQDKRIKELESENKVGEFWHSAYRGKQLDYDKVYAELRQSYNEIQQLKQSQKQLAISELEKMRHEIPFLAGLTQSETFFVNYNQLRYYIDNQIKELKGEE